MTSESWRFALKVNSSTFHKIVSCQSKTKWARVRVSSSLSLGFANLCCIRSVPNNIPLEYDILSIITIFPYRAAITAKNTKCTVSHFFLFDIN